MPHPLLRWRNHYPRAGTWLLSQGLLLCALALLIGPYVALAIAVLSGHYGDGQAFRHAFPFSGRQMMLLGQSILFSGIVAGSAMGLGVLSALWLRDAPRFSHVVLSILPVLIIVPVYLHGLAWATCLATINSWLLALGVEWPLCQGWSGSGWTEVMALLPLATGIALVGLQAVNRALVDAASLHQPVIRVFKQIELPLAAPFLLVGLGLLFLISLLDYSIPSLYAVNVYAMEIFTQYSLDGNPAAAVMTALPLVLVATAVIVFVLARVRQAASVPPFRRVPTVRRAYWPRWFRLLQRLALALLMAQAVVPTISMLALVRSVPAWVRAVTLARVEIGSTTEITLLVLLVGLPLSLIAARPLSRVDWMGKTWWTLLCLPFAMPAPLTGIGAIHLSSLLACSDPGPWLPVLANLTRFVPIAAFVCYAVQRRIDPGLREAGRLYQRSPWHSFLWVTVPLYRPGLLLAGVLLVTLTAGELGATLLVVQPGAPTVMIRLYNLLHYGASGEVAALCLTLMAGIGVIGVCMLWGSAIRQRSGLPIK